MIVFDKSVIAPVVHRSRPNTTESVPTEFDSPARTLPEKSTLEPSVEEAATAQKTFLAEAPLMSSTLASSLTVSEEPIWKVRD